MKTACPSGSLQIELHAALVAVQVLKVRAGPISDDVLSAGCRRFDTDHIGTPIGEVAHAGRACPRKRQIDHAQSG